jgi:nucleoside-diphosphate-sugar epimerase
LRHFPNLYMLRLADVIGAFDESFRVWKYVTLLSDPDYSSVKVGVEVKDTMTKLSFTYSSDVVRVILACIASDLGVQSAINIACSEMVTLLEFLVLMKEFCSSQKKIQVVDQNSYCTKFLPSVDCGPINISKAIKEINFKPTPLVSSKQHNCLGRGTPGGGSILFGRKAILKGVLEHDKRVRGQQQFGLK